ncbi:hypothetical protein Tco_0631283 [Tanacetum coccineum]
MVQDVDISIPSPVVVKDKEQERLSHEAAVRLQEELDEEERQRMARVHETAQSFTKEEWENIRVRVEADKELSKRLQAEKRNKYIEVDQAKMLHMGSHTMQQLKRYSFDELKALFETTMRRVQTFHLIESEGDKVVPELTTESSKRDAEEELDHEDKLQQMMIIVPEQGMNVEALQTKYPIIDWEVYTEDSRKDDLVQLWSLVKERFISTEPTDDKERALWVELKRLFEPDTDDELWKLQRYMHDPLKWRLYDTCGVHHVSTERGIDIFMLVEKEYPLTKGILMLLLVNKLLVDQPSEMANELLRKIFIQAERPRQ